LGSIHLDEPRLQTPRTPDDRIDPDNPSWGVFSAFSVWFASLLLVVFVPLVFLIPYASYRGISPSSPDYMQVLTQFAMSDKGAVLVQVTALLPIHILTVLLVWAVVTRFGKQSFWQAIGWGWARGFRLWSCIGLGVLLFIVASVIAKWLGADTPTQLEQVVNSSYAARIAISILAVGTAPFIEEFVYRGVLYSALRRGVATLGAAILGLFSVQLEPRAKERIGVVGAVVLVLGLFTLIHVPQYWPNLGVIAAVGLLSLVLTVVRAYSGKLLPCIAIHLVFNGIQAVILLVEPVTHRFLPTSAPPPDPASILLPLIRLIN
jgi:membrane protease YdiL (CAAX protease family)